MIIAAGWGTTGRHLFFKATCHLGFPSVHWNWGCLPLPPTEATSPNNNDSSDVSVIKMSPNEIKPRFHTHSKLMNTLSKVSNCLQIKKKKKCGNAIEWQTKVNNLIDELVQDIDEGCFYQNFVYLLQDWGIMHSLKNL